MERLTYDFEIGGNHCWQVKGADDLECREVCERQGDNGCKTCPISKAFDRLAAIEDILGDEYDLDRLRELAQADREGRCAVVPVKLGQPVYCLQDYFNDATMKSEKRVKCRLVDFIPVASKMFETNGLIYQFSEIGKTVFLTREEAEAKLKEREKNG